MRILLLGPEKNKKDPTKTGGIVVLYENLLSWIQQNKDEIGNVSFEYVDTNKDNYSNKLNSFVFILFRILKKLPAIDTVMVNGTANDYLFIVPFIVCLAKVFKKKVVLRKFAGNFNEVYDNSNLIIKKILGYVLRNSDLLCWETKYLVKFGEKFNEKNFWLPNIRFAHEKEIVNKQYNKTFCFISHVTTEKGVMDIVDAAQELDDTYQIDVYGPLLGDLKENDVIGKNISYCGVLTSNEVTEKLSEYSFLLLPSRRKREGYPGIIIEGYSVGIPVIATRIGGIPEIVEDGITGFLIEPGDSEALANAIKNINDDFYTTASHATLKKFKEFDAEYVYPKMLTQMLAL